MDVIYRHLDHGDPEYENRPSRIVVHAMGYRIFDGANWYYAASWLKHLGLSAHALVAPDGTIIRCRRDREVAWHARGHNYDTLGIEFLVPEAPNIDALYARMETPYVTDAQFKAGVDQISQWMYVHDIAMRDVVGHDAIDPERKRDPGPGFPWDALIETLRDRGRV